LWPRAPRRRLWKRPNERAITDGTASHGLRHAMALVPGLDTWLRTYGVALKI
jgi:hypothetical protein